LPGGSMLITNSYSANFFVFSYSLEVFTMLYKKLSVNFSG
jgi:hypothetical protein